MSLIFLQAQMLVSLYIKKLVVHFFLVPLALIDCNADGYHIYYRCDTIEGTRKLNFESKSVTSK